MKLNLVTGGAGFVGAALARKLVDMGEAVIVVDNLSTGKIEAVPQGVTFIEGDCGDTEIIEGLSKYNFDVIYHVAGQSSGEISFEDPLYDLKANTQSTLLLLQLARRIGCRKFVFASTMSVYGEQPDQPISEKMNPMPKSFYAVGKLASELYLKIYTQFGINATALRLFNIYGSGQNMKNLKQGMVSIFLAQAIQNKSIHVKGSENRYRDFVHVSDVVNAFILSAKSECEGYRCYNVCTGVRTEISTLLTIMNEYLLYEIDIVYKGNTLGDQFGIYGDRNLIVEELNWRVKVDLKSGLKQMVKWAIKNESKA